MGLELRRVRHFLDERAVGVVLLLLVAAVAGAAVTYGAYVDPGTHTETRPGETASFTGEFSHQATVTADNPVFEAGTTLSDREAYLTGVSPTLDGTFSYTYTASGDHSLTADGTLSLVVRSVDEGGGAEPPELWRTTRPLDSVENATLAPGESLTLSFSANVTEIQTTVDRIRRELGTTTGTVRIEVVADVDADGRVDGRPIDRSRRYVLPIEPGQGTYRVDDPGPVVTETNRTERVEVENSYGLRSRAGGPFALGVGVLGLVAFGGARRRGLLELDADERAALVHDAARREHDEWITSGRVSRLQGDERLVEVDSLTGLVDVAIDTGSRVIEDPSKPEYVVLADGVVYRYTGPNVTADPIDGT